MATRTTSNSKKMANLLNIPMVDENGKKSGVTLGDLFAEGGKEVTLTVKVTRGQAMMVAPTAARPVGRPRKVQPAATEVKAVRKNSKVYTMLRLLARKNGATKLELKEALQWTNGGVDSYLYHEPTSRGYTLEKLKRGTQEAFKLGFPRGVSDIVVA